jgi:Ca2+-binding RTX toxin-like protein
MAVINGTEGNDSLDGTNSADLIKGSAGNDSLYGLDGFDSLFGGTGNDEIRAGDAMIGTAKTALFGGAGDDVLWGGQGDDTLMGGSGNDTIYASQTKPDSGHDHIEGGEGDDYMSLIGVSATAIGGEGSDHFVVRAGGNRIDGTEVGNWVDTVDYRTVFNRVVVNLAKGTAQTFDFGGTVGRDKLTDIEAVYGSDGDDKLIGGNPLNDGFEAFMGGAGTDTINGGRGHDVLFADRDGLENGVTVDLQRHFAIDIYGNRDSVFGIEEVYATDFDDDLSGNAADNRFYLYGGDDHVNGRAGLDEISFHGTNFVGFAGVVVDLATGTATGAGTKVLTSIEMVTGSAMDDRISGNAGRNSLNGGGGNDWLSGRAGDDVLWGNSGDDRLTGGAGADTFVFRPRDGHDIVMDFTPGQDDITLSGYGFTTLGQVMALAHQDRLNTVFAFADGAEVTLRNVQLSDLSPSDFTL